jgi:hypothetical protein
MERVSRLWNRLKECERVPEKVLTLIIIMTYIYLIIKIQSVASCFTDFNGLLLFLFTYWLYRIQCWLMYLRFLVLWFATQPFIGLLLYNDKSLDTRAMIMANHCVGEEIRSPDPDNYIDCMRDALKDHLVCSLDACKPWADKIKMELPEGLCIKGNYSSNFYKNTMSRYECIGSTLEDLEIRGDRVATPIMTFHTIIYTLFYADWTRDKLLSRVSSCVNMHQEENRTCTACNLRAK